MRVRETQKQKQKFGRKKSECRESVWLLYSAERVERMCWKGGQLIPRNENV